MPTPPRLSAALVRRNCACRPRQRQPGQVFDGHGSERTVTNGSETVTGTINFEAFGQTAGSTGSSSSPYMFAGSWGYRTDGDAGLMHVGARYYDAQVGRFITRDTVLSEHPYLYCEHDPVNAVDPSGHDGVRDRGRRQLERARSTPIVAPPFPGDPSGIASQLAAEKPTLPFHGRRSWLALSLCSRWWYGYCPRSHRESSRATRRSRRQTGASAASTTWVASA
jgi:RHS repeat-associated protein